MRQCNWAEKNLIWKQLETDLTGVHTVARAVVQPPLQLQNGGSLGAEHQARIALGASDRLARLAVDLRGGVSTKACLPCM